MINLSVKCSICGKEESDTKIIKKSDELITKTKEIDIWS